MLFLSHLLFKSPFYITGYLNGSQKVLVDSHAFAQDGPLAKVVHWSWDGQCQAQDGARIWDLEIFTKQWKCKYERHLKSNFTSFMVWPREEPIKVIQPGQVLEVPMGRVRFFFLILTYIVFIIQWFYISCRNVSFLSYNMFLNPSYNRIILESRKHSQCSALAPPWAMRVCGCINYICPNCVSTLGLPKALCSPQYPWFCSSLSHKMVETENITPPKRSLATYVEDSLELLKWSHASH